MQNAFAKLAFSIANRNSTVNQLSDAEMLKSSLGLAGMAGGYELSRLMELGDVGDPSRRLRNLFFYKSVPSAILRDAGSSIGSSVAKSNLSNTAKAIISAGGIAAGTAGLGRIGYDLYKAIR